MYLNPTVEYKHISEWLSTLVGEKITPRNFVKRLSKHLNKHNHPVRVKLFIRDSDSLDPGEFTIGAEYNPDLDEKHRKQFIIDFIFNHPKTVPYEITTDIANRMAIELMETLIHEYEHQRQYRSRRYRVNKEKYVSEHYDPKIKEDQEYLGDPDEINAYAANIAARYYILNYQLNTNEPESLDLKTYFKAFGEDHEVTKLLLSKIEQNINYYKENDNGKNHRRAFKRPQFKRR